MSLKTEIDKTNDLKNKTKKAKDNINAKLTELGGQNANNLADVPSKMQGMIGQYKKMAKGSSKNILVDATNPDPYSDFVTITIPLKLNFIPQKIVYSIEIKSEETGRDPFHYEATLSSDIKHYKPEMYVYLFDLLFKEFSKDSFKISLNFTSVDTYRANIYWRAIE